MDRIVIEDLEVSLRVGVPDAERTHPQRLLLTVELDLDFAAAARTDDLTHTIDYYQLSRRVLAFGEGREWKLIETLAVDLARMILADFKPARVAVVIKKFVLTEARWVSARVERPP